MNEDYMKLKAFAQKRLDDSCENDNDYDVRYWVGYIDGLNALRRTGKTAEALEKQIPKKPYLGKALGYKNIIGHLCPICRSWLLYPDEIPNICDSFCPRRGQKIDWPEVAE